MNEYRTKLLKENRILTIENKMTRNEWRVICANLPLTDEFIIEFQSSINWLHLSANEYLSEKMIRKFYNKVDWYFLSKNRVLSDDCCRDFKHLIHWDAYFYFQESSYPILKDFLCKTNYKNIYDFKHSHLTIEQIQNIRKTLELKSLFLI